jgi:Cytochrome P460
MSRMTKVLLVTAIMVFPVVLLAADDPGSFSPYVDNKGNITLPEGIRATWAYLGTWVVTSKAPPSGEGPGTGLHDAYTQPESVKAYKKDGKWPDGTVIVQEIRSMMWDDLPTGHVIYAGDTTKWFVMVKDGQNRFKDHPNWGDGWGWALFVAADKKNVSTDYRNDCRGCHEPARETDWVFIQGYPTLR